MGCIWNSHRISTVSSRFLHGRGKQSAGRGDISISEASRDQERLRACRFRRKVLGGQQRRGVVERERFATWGLLNLGNFLLIKLSFAGKKVGEQLWEGALHEKKPLQEGWNLSVIRGGGLHRNGLG